LFERGREVGVGAQRLPEEDVFVQVDRTVRVRIGVGPADRIVGQLSRVETGRFPLVERQSG
jgi:hypothetical protein